MRADAQDGCARAARNEWVAELWEGAVIANVDALRMVTWNCGGGLRKKLERLLAFDPTVAVVQECDRATVDDLNARGVRTCWVGENESKGIGVLSWLADEMCVDESYDPTIRWFVQVRIGELRLLAAWAMNHRDRLEQRSNLLEAASRYGSFLDSRSALVLGDLNANAIWETRTRRLFTNGVEALGRIGLESAYHRHTGEGFGQETRATYFHQWRETAPYMIDYCFVPTAWQVDTVEIPSFAEWAGLSDHRPLVVTFRPGQPTAT